MSIITRNNYEEFFLDYIEGEISAANKTALEAFLVLHPDLKAELDEMMDMDFSCDKASVEINSDALKTIPFQTNFDDFCIAHLEGDLNDYENLNFENYIAKNPNKAKELALYYQTKIEADKDLIYTNKKNLKRRNKTAIIKQFVYTTLSAAASVALLFSVWNSELEKQEPQFKSEHISQNTSFQIVDSDSVHIHIPKEISNVKTLAPNSPSKKKNSNAKSKIIKGKIQNKRIIKIDALPIKVQILNKKIINKIEIKELLADNRVYSVQKKNLPDLKIITKDKTPIQEVQNTGLAMLGLSWKASKGEQDPNKKSTLLKIASFGVNQIGKLAGKKINLEKKYDPKTDKTRVAFSTFAIGFSAPVK